MLCADLDYPTSGLQVRECRLRLRMAQKRLALEAGLSASRLASYEKGESRPPPVAVVARITEVLQLGGRERSRILNSAWVERQGWTEFGDAEPERAKAIAEINMCLAALDPDILIALGISLKASTKPQHSHVPSAREGGPLPKGN